MRKTTSSQALPIYLTLAELSPSELAEVDINSLQNILHPIGLSEIRAKQLYEVATAVASNGTQALSSKQFLQALVGVGRYISNAVLCVGFGIPLPALDTNMIRVLQRVFSWTSNKRRARDDNSFWDFAASLVPANQPKEFNWGILDLAALVCTPRNPACQECPLIHICDYYQETIQGQHKF